MLLSYDEVRSLMDDIADSFPQEFYEELNGAVILLPELNSQEDEPDLLIMGTYCCDQLGRRIELYYGSFAELAENEEWTKEDWRQELWDTLAHEFTHHIESLAGERGLERKDAAFMEQYRAHKEPDPSR